MTNSQSISTMSVILTYIHACVRQTTIEPNLFYTIGYSDHLNICIPGA